MANDDPYALIRTLFTPGANLPPLAPGEQVQIIDYAGSDGWVVLDRIQDVPKPDYCTHGRTQCMAGCGFWVWLGPATRVVVSGGVHRPICKPCANQYVTPGSVPHGTFDDSRHPEPS